ncbi:hypothetical protein H2200_006271 [Cladophialophora chaetospira]|uniref:Uncharacterized protein n=1 Tax=Cladophialophora chaetospira TaxID=386627 RepID=A0AA39CJ81_9EURO|nr:hypothetical protein H2200_006271 [Cladophialophora chaetospira]
MSKRFIRATGSLDPILIGFGVLAERQAYSWISSLANLASWCCPFTHFDYAGWWESVMREDVDYVNGRVRRIRCGDTVPGTVWKTTGSSKATNKTIRWEGQVLEVQGLRLGQITMRSAWSHRQFDAHGLEICDAVIRLSAIHSTLYSDASRLRTFMIRLFEKIVADRKRRHDREHGGISRQPTSDKDLPNMEFCSTDSSVSFFEPVDRVQDLILGELLRVAKENDRESAVSDLDSEEIKIADIAIREHLVRSFRGCSFFLIDSEFVGLAPYDSRGGFEGGSEVWLLAGCSMPVVLEKATPDGDSGKTRYKVKSKALVDTVTIHGKRCRVMEGEAWKTAEREDFEWVSIV